MRILQVVGVLVGMIALCSAEAPQLSLQQPQTYRSVSVGVPYQDDTNNPGIDLNQLLASAGESLPNLQGSQNAGYAVPQQGYSSSQYVAPATTQGYSAPQQGYAAPALKQGYSVPQQQAYVPAAQQGYSSPAQQGGYSQPGLSDDANYLVRTQVSIHVPPPDAEFFPAPVRQARPLQSPEKHYKVIFIKAPSPPTYSPIDYTPPPQPEQKTLVYVLVKKPEPPAPIVYPTVVPTPASKPEVYFIRYRTPEQGGGYASPQPQQFGAPLIGGYDTPSPPAAQPVFAAPLATSAQSQNYGAPAQPVFAAPVQNYATPAYSAPLQNYATPAYSAPQQNYVTPAYSAPQQNYGAPSTLRSSYVAPARGYPAAPVKSGYSVPSYNIQLPSMSYGPPVTKAMDPYYSPRAA